jgi:hypothetical protein
VKRRRVLIVSAVVVAIVAVGVTGLWLRERPKALELSVLKGVPVHEFRPVQKTKAGGVAFSQTIYYVETDYDEAVKSIQADLGNPGQHGGLSNSWGWFLEPGPFQFHGQQVNIRRNKVDPHSMEVLGKGADSKRWVTVWISGSLNDPNIARGLWRAVTGNKRP